MFQNRTIEIYEGHTNQPKQINVLVNVSLIFCFGLTEDASIIVLIEMYLMTTLKEKIQESSPKDGMIFVQFSKQMVYNCQYKGAM